MIEIAYNENLQDESGRMVGYHWPAVTENHTCQPVRITGKSDVTISVSGTMGGCSVALVVSSEESGQAGYPASHLGSDTAIALVSANTSATALQKGIWYTPTPSGGSSQSIGITLIAT